MIQRKVQRELSALIVEEEWRWGKTIELRFRDRELSNQRATDMAKARKSTKLKTKNVT